MSLLSIFFPFLLEACMFTLSGILIFIGGLCILCFWLLLENSSLLIFYFHHLKQLSDPVLHHPLYLTYSFTTSTMLPMVSAYFFLCSSCLRPWWRCITILKVCFAAQRNFISIIGGIIFLWEHHQGHMDTWRSLWSSCQMCCPHRWRCYWCDCIRHRPLEPGTFVDGLAAAKDPVAMMKALWTGHQSLSMQLTLLVSLCFSMLPLGVLLCLPDAGLLLWVPKIVQLAATGTTVDLILSSCLVLGPPFRKILDVFT